MYNAIAWDNGEQKVVYTFDSIEEAVYFAGELSYEFDHAIAQDTTTGEYFSTAA